MRYLLALILSLLPLAFGQTPFPILFSTKTINTAQQSSFVSAIISYVSSLEQQPTYTSFSSYMATATGLPDDVSSEFSSVSYNPLSLVEDYFTATATPAWYTEITSPLQSYVSSVASGEASIASKIVNGSGAGRVEAKVAVMGSLLAAMLVGMLLL
jgi:hypothetical protein